MREGEEEKMIYFDNAATSFPKPQGMENSIREYYKKYGANPGRSGHRMSMGTAKMVYKSREKIYMFFNAGSVEDVIFTYNCTMASNMIIKGILSKGDHVIISGYEHNAVLRPVHKLKSEGIISYDIAEVFENDNEKTLLSYKRLMRKNTKLVISIHGSNVFGIVLPVKEIAKIAHESGAMFMVDAAQTAGVIPIDMKNEGIDFLCAPGHKSLYGPTGTGLLITGYGQRLDTVIEGGTGSVSENYFQPNFMPDRLESGTVNTLGIIGLLNGVNFINKNGVGKIYSHEMAIIQYIYKRLKKIRGIKLYTQYPKEGTHLPVLSFNVEGKSCDEVVKILDRKGFALRGGLHCSPLAHISKGTIDKGTVRISIGYFNNINQAEKLCGTISKII